ncbi:MAG: toll/interleukin-1 receptor domain-containing protein [Bacteriovoracaceae bacterium]|jgi:hypothetical protein|nr:toll/interleukin-1 receptor domain-containing protein [Bacteriovoracaceae bacterium]
MSEHIVFISYSSKDVVVAKQILEYLEKNGIQCWMAPRNIIPGKHYASSILDAIKSSKAFFLLFSPYSNISEQCLKEVDRAVNAKLPIIPFRIEDHPPTEAMEYYLCNTHWMDAFSKETGDYFPQLLSTCRRILAGNTPKIVTPSRLQKKREEISDGMQEMLKKVDNSIAADEEERKKFHKKHTNVEKTKSSMINPLIEPTLGNYKVESFLKEQNKEIVNKNIKKKKKKRKYVELKSASEISRQKTTKLRNKLIVPFLLILFGVFTVYTFKMMVKRNNEFKRKLKTTKIQKIEEIKKNIDYKYLSTNLLNLDDLSFIDKKNISEYRALINYKDGNLFKRVGGLLVENTHNRIELNNLASLDMHEHRPRFEILKQFQNNDLDLKKQYPLVFLDPSSIGEITEVEGSWNLHNEILKRLLRDHTVQALSTKEYPDQDDFSRDYYAADVSLLVRVRILKKKKKYLQIQYQVNKNKMIILNTIKKHSSRLSLLKYPLSIKETNQVSKKTTVMEFNYSGGENIKETLENKDYKMIKIILSEIIAEIANQIASLK